MSIIQDLALGQQNNIRHGLVSGQLFFFFAAFHCSLLGFNAFIASFLCREGKQVIKSKAGAINCCKENKITAPPNEWHNIPFILFTLA